MKTRFLFVALPLLAGCSTDPMTGDMPGAPDDRVPIRLTAGIEVQTRAHTDMDAQFPAGRDVAFWVDNAATGEQLYGNNVLRSDGSDGFTGGEPMFFPQGGDAVDIYALHTNAALTETFPEAALTHTVASDQRAAGDYHASDLLYAANRGVAKTTSAVPVTFYHMLSKVRIAIAPGTPETDLAGAKVEIVGTKTSAAFTPSKTADPTDRTVRATMVEATGSAGDISLDNAVSADFTVANVDYNDAVVVPQTVAAGEDFIRITLADRTTLLTWKPTAALNLESGKRYTYEVTVTRNGLNVVAVVSDWEDDGGINYKKLISLGLSFAKIPAGTFLMGRDSSQFFHWSAPIHEVTLTQDFYMSRYETTNAQYAAFLNAEGIGADGKWASGQYPDQCLIVASSSTSDWGLHWNTDKWEPVSGYANHPVIYVTWYGAKAFADWVGGALPTEAQWEYACRAGVTGGGWSFGNSIGNDNDYMWCRDWNANGTKAVGTKLPNPWGLYDMYGNVEEWCSDWFGAYDSNAATDPTGPDTGDYRISRGGGWNGSAMRDCRNEARWPGYFPYYAREDIGFRVVFVP